MATLAPFLVEIGLDPVSRSELLDFLSGATAEDCAAARDRLVESGGTAKAIEQALTCLRQMFDAAVRRGLRLDNPMPSPARRSQPSVMVH